MSISKAFAAQMEKMVDELKTNANINTTTNTAVFDASKVTLPEGVTTESMEVHANVINQLSAASEHATALIAQDMFANNKELTTLDSTLSLCGGLSIQSQHHLKQGLGHDTFLYGEAATIVDFIGSAEQAEWLKQNREHNRETAAKLFAK